MCSSTQVVEPLVGGMRICLVGEVANDIDSVEAARTFGIPIITSQTGLELIEDYEWRTYFILNDFDSPNFEMIQKGKQW